PYSKACTADKRPSRRNGFAGSRCVLLTHAIDRSSHCTTSSKRHIRSEWGISVRISALLIGMTLKVVLKCYTTMSFRAKSRTERLGFAPPRRPSSRFNNLNFQLGAAQSQKE